MQIRPCGTSVSSVVPYPAVKYNMGSALVGCTVSEAAICEALLRGDIVSHPSQLLKLQRSVLICRKQRGCKMGRALQHMLPVHRFQLLMRFLMQRCPANAGKAECTVRVQEVLPLLSSHQDSGNF